MDLRRGVSEVVHLGHGLLASAHHFPQRRATQWGSQVRVASKPGDNFVWLAQLGE
jgi:hypothetical protein